MLQFEYTALRSDGKTVTGTIEANNQEAALGKIRAWGIFPTHIKQVGEGEGSSGYIHSTAQSSINDKRRDAPPEDDYDSDPTITDIILSSGATLGVTALALYMAGNLFFNDGFAILQLVLTVGILGAVLAAWLICSYGVKQVIAENIVIIVGVFVYGWLTGVSTHNGQQQPLPQSHVDVQLIVLVAIVVLLSLNKLKRILAAVLAGVQGTARHANEYQRDSQEPESDSPPPWRKEAIQLALIVIGMICYSFYQIRTKHQKFRESIEATFCETSKYVQNSPEDIDGAVKRYENIRGQCDSWWLKEQNAKAESQIQALRTKNREVDTLLTELKARAENVVTSQNEESSIERFRLAALVFSSYTGLLAKETATARGVLQQFYDKKRIAEQRAVRAQQQELQRQIQAQEQAEQQEQQRQQDAQLREQQRQQQEREDHPSPQDAGAVARKYIKDIKDRKGLLSASLVGYQHGLGAECVAIYNCDYISQGGMHMTRMYSVSMSRDRQGNWGILAFEPDGVFEGLPLESDWRRATGGGQTPLNRVIRQQGGY